MKNWIADPEHLGGSPRVRGTRISVALILESLAAGLVGRRHRGRVSEPDRGIGARRAGGTSASNFRSGSGGNANAGAFVG